MEKLEKKLWQIISLFGNTCIVLALIALTFLISYRLTASSHSAIIYSLFIFFIIIRTKKFKKISKAAKYSQYSRFYSFVIFNNQVGVWLIAASIVGITGKYMGKDSFIIFDYLNWHSLVCAIAILTYNRYMAHKTGHDFSGFG